MYGPENESVESIESEADLRAMLEKRREDEERKQFKLDAIGKLIAEKRSTAIAERKQSGFERAWQEDTEYYQGFDDLNREVDDYLKSRSTTGGLTDESVHNKNDITAFINATRPFVDAGASRMGDILLPATDWPFSIKHSPVPELDEDEDDAEIAEDEAQLNGMQQPGQQGILGPDGAPMPTKADKLKELKKELARKATGASDQIKDWLVACRYKTESRAVIEDGAKIGTGILKGPFPEKYTLRKWVDGELQIIERIQPTSKRVDPWNFFPDMNCGEDIQKGDYVFEREYMTQEQLSDLKGLVDSGYIDSAIDKVLEQGPLSSVTGKPKENKSDGRFEVWYYYGNMKSSELALVDDEHECVCKTYDEDGELLSEEDKSDEFLPVTIVMVNDTVVKGFVNPLGDTEFPFDLFVWQKVAGKPFGIGVARQGRAAQNIILVGIRALLKNMKLSAVPMLGVIRDAIRPEIGGWEMEGGKIWSMDKSAGLTIDQAIKALVIPDQQERLTALIELGLKTMEESTGISFLLQGQVGSAPDTLGGMQMMHNNASALLRRVARIYDESITIPHIKRYHNYMLVDPEVKPEIKGDLEIEAIGSSSLVEREIQAMQLPQILEMSLNPLFKKSPKKAMDEVLKSMKFDAGKFDLDPQEEQEQQQQQEAMQQAMAAQQEAQMALQQMKNDVAMQIAQMKADIELQKVAVKSEESVQKMEMDMDRDQVYAATQANRTAFDQQATIAKMELEERLAMLKYANEQQITLGQAKLDLTIATQKINLQRELSTQGAAEQIVTPMSEPAGKAPEGQAFQK